MKETLTKGYEIVREDGLTEVCRAASRQFHRNYYNWREGSDYNTRGVNIHEEDWDNLIILDACRYDYFKKCCEIPGELEYRISRGSQSKEFIRGNFTDVRAYDTVYLSDNPWYGRLHEDIGSELHHFSFCKRDAFDGTVSYPSTVTETAVEYHETFPNKRLIVHYMQPHAPFFDSDGNELYRWPSDEISCDPTELKESYTRNLRLVLSEVEELLSDLVGKTVVTSDHGELLGERLPPCPFRQFQHPGGIYRKELVQVPWFKIDGGGRKDIVDEGEPAQWDYKDPKTEEIENQLEALGYL